MAQQPHDRALESAPTAALVGRAQRRERDAALEGLEDEWMDVALTADGRRVAQLARDRRHGLDDCLLPVSRGGDPGPWRPPRPRDGGCPGAKAPCPSGPPRCPA